jgi:hypothetical protein
MLNEVVVARSLGSHPEDYIFSNLVMWAQKVLSPVVNQMDFANPT